MECLYQDALTNYNIIVFAGPPGTGKTTLALRLVAYALRKEKKCSAEEECLAEAAQRLFMGENLEDLLEFLISLTERAGDYIIVDDAAVGYWDVADPFAWSLITDALKVARNAIATRALIFTTTSTKFISKRVLNMARVYYVKRAVLGHRVLENGCIDWESKGRARAVVVKHIMYALSSPTAPSYTPARIGLYAATVAAVPLDQKYAMPAEIEKMHLDTRKARARASLIAALERIRKRSGEKRIS